MSFITVDFRDRKQLGEQLRDNIKNLILSGELKPDDKLPSVRSLARELGLNPNTIQKAYTELEREGVIVTLPGRGSIVIAEKGSLRSGQIEGLVEKMAALAAEMSSSGITEEEFLESAKNGWRKTGGMDV